MNIQKLWAMITAFINGLCCQGSIVTITFFTGIGLGTLKEGPIGYPLLFFFLAVLVYSVNYRKQNHKDNIPLHTIQALSLFLIIGIFYQPVVWIGAVGIFVGSLWDYTLCTDPCIMS